MYLRAQRLEGTPQKANEGTHPVGWDPTAPILSPPWGSFGPRLTSVCSQGDHRPLGRDRPPPAQGQPTVEARWLKARGL